MVPTVMAFDVTSGALEVPVAPARPAITPTEAMTAENAKATIPTLATTSVLRLLLIAPLSMIWPHPPGMSVAAGPSATRGPHYWYSILKECCEGLAKCVGESTALMTSEWCGGQGTLPVLIIGLKEIDSGSAATQAPWIALSRIQP
jgi:hypothetical protein